MGRQRGTAICPDFLPLLALLLLSVAPASVQSQQGTPQECGALADKHNIIPGYSWGSADATTQQRWTTQDCDANICIYWKTTYNVVPWATWGTLPDKFKPSWSWVQPKHQASCGQLSGAHLLEALLSSWCSDNAATALHCACMPWEGLHWGGQVLQYPPPWYPPCRRSTGCQRARPIARVHRSAVRHRVRRCCVSTGH